MAFQCKISLSSPIFYVPEFNRHRVFTSPRPCALRSYINLIKQLLLIAKTSTITFFLRGTKSHHRITDLSRLVSLHNQGRRHSQKSGAERLALGGAITQGAASLKGAAWQKKRNV